MISITDGQIYLSPSLFELGVLPAVDVGKSVSRVGGKAQRAVFRLVAGDLKLTYAQFEELETFARFGASLDEDTAKSIGHGRRIRASLRQPESSPLPVSEQIILLLALTSGLLDTVELTQMTEAKNILREMINNLQSDISERLENAASLSDEDRNSIIELSKNALSGINTDKVGFVHKKESEKHE